MFFNSFFSFKAIIWVLLNEIMIKIVVSSEQNNTYSNYGLNWNSNQFQPQSLSSSQTSLTLINKPNRTGEDEEWLDNLGKLYQNVSSFRIFYLYAGTFITTIGAILNALCIVVFYKSKLFRNSSFPYYVYVISFVDILNVFLRFLVPQSYELFVRNVLESKYGIDKNEIDTLSYDHFTTKIVNDYDCSVYIYVLNSLTLVSVWLMVAVSLERLIVIKFALQTKDTIKMRAILILIFIFICAFGLNVFDLAPGLYISPTWYANLTLLCERDDMISSEHNDTRIYKSLGSFQFDTQIFALTRTLMQTVVPFLFVLIFNSLIIYNFKKIKSAAFSHSKPGINHITGKSNSCVSVASAGSYNLSAVNYLFQKETKKDLRANKKKSMIDKSRAFGTAKQDGLSRQKPDSSTPSHQLKIPSAVKSSLSTHNYQNSSRSPSPLNSLSFPATPTSLVSTFNLPDQTNNNLRDDGIQNESNMTALKPLRIVPAANMKFESQSHLNSYNESSSSGNEKLLSPSRRNHIVSSKQYSSSYLMPPSAPSMANTITSSSQAATTITNCCSGSSRTPSLGTNNSSANLSIATTTNLTSTTSCFNKPQSNQDQHKPNLTCTQDGTNGLGSSPTRRSNERISFYVTTPSGDGSGTPFKGRIATVNASTNTSRVSFKSSRSHRSSARMKLNRETDIMLIVLSFSILLSQLPCTISWYLIYYRNILKNSNTENIFVNGLTPIYLFTIRLIEMIYFSLNFFFYITLSPSLRREIKAYISKVLLDNFSTKVPNNQAISPNKDRHKKESSVLKEKKEVSITPLPSPSYNKHQLPNSKFINNNCELLDRKLRLHSNSSGEFMEYFEKLRSISPLRRPNTLVKQPFSDERSSLSIVFKSSPRFHGKKFCQVEIEKGEPIIANKTGVEHKKRNPRFKSLMKYVRTKKTKKEENLRIESSNLLNNSRNVLEDNRKNSEIKIVIDNPNDEDLRMDEEIVLDKFEENSSERFDALAKKNDENNEKVFKWECTALDEEIPNKV